MDKQDNQRAGGGGGKVPSVDDGAAQGGGLSSGAVRGLSDHSDAARVGDGNSGRGRVGNGLHGDTREGRNKEQQDVGSDDAPLQIVLANMPNRRQRSGPNQIDQQEQRGWGPLGSERPSNSGWEERSHAVASANNHEYRRGSWRGSARQVEQFDRGNRAYRSRTPEDNDTLQQRVHWAGAEDFVINGWRPFEGILTPNAMTAYNQRSPADGYRALDGEHVGNWLERFADSAGQPLAWSQSTMLRCLERFTIAIMERFTIAIMERPLFNSFKNAIVA
ncbi:hypothetical protein AeMF1_007684 [Aphanomyces euteiches]|nr:hypothetical protein AeMF1_007684 [Aphanomyces euteiches]KAH9162649.1 hypothetical protein AeNC1_018819 [Aphanomyces euteiches]